MNKGLMLEVFDCEGWDEIEKYIESNLRDCYELLAIKENSRETDMIIKGKIIILHGFMSDIRSLKQEIKKDNLN